MTVEAAKSTSRASTLLLVDDETGSRQALALLLVSAGFDVRQAADVRQAEEQLARGDIGIAVIDSDMPHADGIELCAQLRKQFASAIYLILRTTKDELLSRDLSVDDGADDFLIEPLTDKEVLARIETGRKMKQLQEKLEDTNRSLAHLAVTDELTGAYNKRRIDSEIEKEMERARRYGRPLSLMLVDLDGFRTLNEKQGRVAGNRALVEVSRILRLSTRGTDSVGRHGGEEFAVLLPETPKENAFGTAEKIRKVIEQTAIAVGGKTLHVTVSVGIATFLSNNFADASDLVGAANRALLLAKEAGRNRCSAVE